MRALGAAAAACASATVLAQPPRIDFELTHRSRFESVDPQYRPSFPPSDQALALRTTLRIDAQWRRFRFTGELMDSRAELNELESPNSTAIVNTLEPIQLSGTWDLLDADSAERSTLTIGWLTKDIGSRRFIARNRFRNTPHAFAGADWFWRSASGIQLNAFYLHPIQRLPDTPSALFANEQQLDNVPSGTAVTGFHLQSTLGVNGTLGELLLLKSDGPDVRAPDSGFHDLLTLSLRASRPPDRGEWDFEVETALQDGTSRTPGGAAELDHRARFLHVSAGYTWDVPLAPRLVAQYDYASGDDAPFDTQTERFDPLYGARSFEIGPSGIYGPIARSNFESIDLRGSLQLTPRWTLMSALRGYWLASPTDAWIIPGLRDVSGASGDYIGRQLESSLVWRALPERLTLQLGLVHLRYGRFALTVPDATGRSHTTYLYGQLTYRFATSRSP